MHFPASKNSLEAASMLIPLDPISKIGCPSYSSRSAQRTAAFLPGMQYIIDWHPDYSPIYRANVYGVVMGI